MIDHYRVWSDAFWSAINHGMSEQEAERHAADKLAAFDKARANQRRDAAQRAQDPSPDEHDYINY